MRNSTDALRSLARYLWKILEDEVPVVWEGNARNWEIRLWGDEQNFGFPFARVAAITPVSYTGPASWREATRTFALHLYPVPKDTSEDSIMEVERVEELLTVGFETGFVYTDKPDPNDPSTWVDVASAPRRVPLYDYDGVPLDGPNSMSYARGPNDYLRIASLTINRMVDPEDERYWLIVAEGQAVWRRLGRMPKDGPVVTSVKLTGDTEG